MKHLYKIKWLIIVISGIMWVISFGILFAGGTAMQNRIALAINIVLIVLQILNVYRAFVVNQKGTAIALIVCLLIILMLMWATYIWSWSYTVKALTIGFE
ncbi:hypothetical protein [Bacteroides acidifaciens]|uniref:hypothetical protein n=1 Tax=Bacteroides acidifaciens TaxID=85831 RepID=UPI0025A505F8|nr:hypothetical protein [Bacteroides acidifaciens]